MQSCEIFAVAVELLSHALLFVTPWTVALPGSSVHGVLQARLLEWVAISSFSGSLDLSIDPVSPAWAVGFFTAEPAGKP